MPGLSAYQLVFAALVACATASQCDAGQCWRSWFQPTAAPTESLALSLIPKFQELHPGCVVHIWVYRDREPERVIAVNRPGGGFVHGDFSNANAYYGLLSNATLHMTEVVITPTGTLIRTIEGPTRRSRVVAGKNPLGPYDHGAEVRFLAEQRGPRIFVRSESLALRNVSVLYEKLRELFVPELVMHVRGDDLFLDDSGYPGFNPFLRENHPPPAPEEFFRLPGVICRVREDGSPPCQSRTAPQL